MWSCIGGRSTPWLWMKLFVWWKSATFLNPHFSRFGEENLRRYYTSKKEKLQKAITEQQGMFKNSSKKVLTKIGLSCMYHGCQGLETSKTSFCGNAKNLLVHLRCRSRQIFGVAKDLFPNFPNLPEKFFCGNLLQLQIFLAQKRWNFFLKKLEFRHILSVSLIDYPSGTKVSKHLYPDFQGYCPDFRQIKTFRGVLAPPTPAPLYLRRRKWQACMVHWICESVINSRHVWNSIYSNPLVKHWRRRRLTYFH